MKTLKILGIAAVLVLFSGAVAYGAGQVIDLVQTDDTTATDDGRVCNENNVRTNNPDDIGEEVRTQTRTRLAWDEDAECDGDQTRLRTQDRSSWSEEDEATRTLTQTRVEGQTEDDDAVTAAAGPSGPGDGNCD